MKNFQSLILDKNSTIKDALDIINKGAMQIALVVENDKLIGIINDGDIIRALLKGYTLESKILDVYHKNPIVCGINDSQDNILNVALRNNVHQIPIIDDSGKIIRVESFEHLLQKKDYKNNILIMAGGKGERLLPITKEKPKSLINVGNKPILQTIIENFSTQGFKNICLSINHKGEQIIDFFGDGKIFGANITYLHEYQRMGTAGSLSLFKIKNDLPFIVMNSDILTSINFESMLNYHIANDAFVTIGVREYLMNIPFGVIELNDNKVVKIVEKPENKYIVSAGIYIFNPGVLKYIKANEYLDMPTLIKLIIKKNLTVIPFHIREYWKDIGHLKDLEEAKNDYSEFFN